MHLYKQHVNSFRKKTNRTIPNNYRKKVRPIIPVNVTDHRVAEKINVLTAGLTAIEKLIKCLCLINLCPLQTRRIL